MIGALKKKGTAEEREVTARNMWTKNTIDMVNGAENNETVGCIF
jgi:hypothetical protein